MARELLERLGDADRHRFTAAFARYGRRGRATVTLLFLDVCDEAGRQVADHLWFKEGKWSKELGVLQAGQVVEFEARVKAYEKGYRGTNEKRAAKRPPHTVDYKLANPTNARVTGEVCDIDVGESRSEKRKSPKRQKQQSDFGSRLSIDSIRRMTAPLMDEFPQVKRIWLFGSCARGTATQESDIDIAYETDGSSFPILTFLGRLVQIGREHGVVIDDANVTHPRDNAFFHEFDREKALLHERR